MECLALPLGHLGITPAGEYREDFSSRPSSLFYASHLNLFLGVPVLHQALGYLRNCFHNLDECKTGWKESQGFLIFVCNHLQTECSH